MTIQEIEWSRPDGMIVWCRPPLNQAQFDYIMGDVPPHYPMPVTSLTAVLAVPPEYVPFKLKARELLHADDHND